MFSNDRGHADQPLVSVIMIFFNAERFIDEAIASVLSQTYERWELLLVDDGSTDGSTEIACSHAAQRPEQIHVLEHPGRANRGTGPSRNLGIAHTRGDYIAFLDADDVWEPNALASLVALAVRQPAAGLIYGPTLKWFGWTGRRKDRRRDELDIAPGRGIVPNQLVEPPDVLTCFLNDSGTVPCMCSLLARRDLVERVGGFDTAFDGVYEDQAFYAKLALVAPVYVTGGCWARYRQHADSMCAVSQKCWPGTRGASALPHLVVEIYDNQPRDRRSPVERARTRHATVFPSVASRRPRNGTKTAEAHNPIVATRRPQSRPAVDASSSSHAARRREWTRAGW